MSISELQRFVEAQDKRDGGFRTALAELEAGAKHSHWIWYVFPQLAGLGRSPMARRFGLKDADEAAAYIEDSVLGTRLLQISRVVAAQLARGVPLETLMGSDIDALKLVSSMTLFEMVAGTLARDELPRALAQVAREILTQAEAQGYPRCAFTLRACSAQGGED
jgi:uncharacterized protein (DUF1810 family)